MNELKAKTKEDLFRSARAGFATAMGLPHRNGNIGGYSVISVDASAGDDITKLITKLIEQMGGLPRRRVMDRWQQLKELLDRAIASQPWLVIVVASAHNLPPRTFLHLKGIWEYSDQAFGPRPGFLLLGRVDIIERALLKYPEIFARTSQTAPFALEIVREQG